VLQVPPSSISEPHGAHSHRAYEGSDGLRSFVHDLTDWLGEHGDSLPRPSPGATLAEEVARTRHNQRVLWDAGWLRYGWPPSVGGLGGSPMLRAVVAEEGTVQRLFYETAFAVTEVLVPTLITESPDLAAAYGSEFLNGSEGWCQGFSEPDAGSDLASLRCRARDNGDHWIVTGQKTWTSYAQFASRMLLLARTGSPESRHRGITAMLVDMDTPGVTVRPLNAINGEAEFSETFFDGAVVPKGRLVGQLDGGWAVAMSILRSERGAIFWMLSAWLLGELVRLVREATVTDLDDEALGHALASIAAIRARSWSTQHRMTVSSVGIPETSIDKILMTTAEQELFDLALPALGGLVEFGEGYSAQDWRRAYMYSRAASIYGGTAEIQRNIVADQLLGLRGLR
jgi:alkylation response protein AidB-like acyl-CoA dehydrogenase